MNVAIVVPDVGMSQSGDLRISAWLVRIGESVIEGDRLVELVCLDATFDVPSPATGRLVRICAGRDQVVRTDELLGEIEPELWSDLGD